MLTINIIKYYTLPRRASEPYVSLWKSPGGGVIVRGKPSAPTSCGTGCFFSAREFPGEGDVELLGI